MKRIIKKATLTLLHTRRFALYLRHTHQLNQIALRKKYQKERYLSLRSKFKSVYSDLSVKYTLPATKLWNENNSILRKIFLPMPPFDFLKNPTISRMMFVSVGGNVMRHELEFCQKVFKKHNLRKLLVEDWIGEPLILNKEYLTSHNLIRHLYHLARFCSSTKEPLTHLKTVVEWGGGYGSLARIYKRIVPDSTYILVDTPLFLTLQWLFLSVIFGPESVNIVKDASARIAKGKFNLLSASVIRNKNIKADLFLSTWGLSESPKESLNLVLTKKWFGARHLLLGIQRKTPKFPIAQRVAFEAIKHGAHEESIAFLRHSKYAFK